MGYYDLAIKSAKKLKENPVVLIPSLILFIFTAFSKTLMFKYGKLGELSDMVNSVTSAVKSNMEPALIAENFQLGMFTTFFQAYWVHLVTSTVLFFVLTFVVGVGTMVFEFVMVRDLVNNKKIQLWKDWKEKGGYFWSVVFIRIFVYVISFLALAIVGAIGLAIYATTTKVTATTITLGAITGGLTLVFLILIKFGLLFRYPMLLLGKTRNPVMVIKETFLFFRNNPAHTFYTWLSILIISIGAGMIGVVFESANGLLAKIASMPNAVLLVIPFILFLIKLVFQVWSDIFLFYNYKEKH